MRDEDRISGPLFDMIEDPVTRRPLRGRDPLMSAEAKDRLDRERRTRELEARIYRMRAAQYRSVQTIARHLGLTQSYVRSVVGDQTPAELRGRRGRSHAREIVERAISMRRAGHSYQRIAEALSVSAKTVSTWMRQEAA